MMAGFERGEKDLNGLLGGVRKASGSGEGGVDDDAMRQATSDSSLIRAPPWCIVSDSGGMGHSAQ
jgi:hypothetical protein